MIGKPIPKSFIHHETTSLGWMGSFSMLCRVRLVLLVDLLEALARLPAEYPLAPTDLLPGANEVEQPHAEKIEEQQSMPHLAAEPERHQGKDPRKDEPCGSDPLHPLVFSPTLLRQPQPEGVRLPARGIDQPVAEVEGYENCNADEWQHPLPCRGAGQEFRVLRIGGKEYAMGIRLAILNELPASCGHNSSCVLSRLRLHWLL